MWFNFRNRAAVAAGGTPFSDTPGARRGRGGASGGDGSLFPPHLYPPRGSTPLFLADKAASAGAGALYPAGLKYTLPQGWRGVLRVLEVFADPLTVASNLTWAVQVNGAPVRGLGQITVMPRAADSFSEVFDQWSVDLPEACTVSVVITNNDGGAYNWLGAKLQGWTFQNEAAYGE